MQKINGSIKLENKILKGIKRYAVENDMRFVKVVTLAVEKFLETEKKKEKKENVKN